MTDKNALTGAPARSREDATTTDNKYDATSKSASRRRTRESGLALHKEVKFRRNRWYNDLHYQKQRNKPDGLFP